MISKYAIIVAGGNGSRMGTETPKQFLPIGDRPVLMHTLEAFHLVDERIQLILALPVHQMDQWMRLCDKHNFNLPHQVVAGGETRFHSVKNGIANVLETFALVAIHDGVRPFVSSNTIVESFNSAEQKGSGIAVVKLKDTIRKLENGKNKSLNREDYVIVQTPQTFQQNILLECFQQEYKDTFTDDASVAEALGHEIHLVDGSYDNIKITTPEDLAFAEVYLNRQKG